MWKGWKDKFIRVCLGILQQHASYSLALHLHEEKFATLNFIIFTAAPFIPFSFLSFG